MKFSVLTAAALLFTALPAAHAVDVEPPGEIAFAISPGSSIAADVAIPAGRALYFTSGTIPMVVDEKAPADSRERFGTDTKTQGVGCLKAIEKLLQAKGLTMKDVVYLRVYVVPDKEKGGQCDFKGWFEAYAQFFGTPGEPDQARTLDRRRGGPGQPGLAHRDRGGGRLPDGKVASAS